MKTCTYLHIFPHAPLVHSERLATLKHVPILQQQQQKIQTANPI